ncbi:MAG: glycerol-3-phosphate 1-O-acyltransferase PlsY [Pseudomonadota bacterium]
MQLIEASWPWLLRALAIGYVIGSIPMGVIVARLFGLGDLRKIGSGNIGATNVLRTGSKVAAACTLVVDMAKGWIAVALFLQWGDLAGQSAGIGAVLGHCLPVWLLFRGGKGVATFLGVILGLDIFAGLLTCATWLAGAAVTRISSAAAMASALSAPLWLMVLGRPEAVLAAAFLAAWVILRHHANIRRLLSGTEPRIGNKGA